jgi:regulatory protein
MTHGRDLYRQVRGRLYLIMDQKITAIKQQKKNRQRVNIYLDGEFAFGLARIVAAWLQVGQEISDEKIAQLQAEDSQEVAYQRALRFISYRPRSQSEVQEKLQESNVPQENIDYVLDRLAKSGILNDESFAQMWVENRSAMRPRGRRALAYELRQRGVDRKTIDQAIAAVDEEELAYQAAQKRARKLQGQEWTSFRQKMFRFLAQRGFMYELCAQIVPRVWNELHSNDNPSDEEVYP